jgi:hypothetical protein
LSTQMVSAKALLLKSTPLPPTEGDFQASCVS